MAKKIKETTAQSVEKMVQFNRWLDSWSAIHFLSGKTLVVYGDVSEVLRLLDGQSA